MNYRSKFHLVILVISSAIILTACGNKADKTLDKMEDVIAKYEHKNGDKTLTAQDLQEMGAQVDSLEQNYSVSGDKPETEWTESEKVRYQQLMARMQKLAYSAGNSGLQ